MNTMTSPAPKSRQIPILVQVPNASLIVAFVADLLAHFLSGQAHSFASAVFYMALTIWAYAEVARGINYVRRVLGLVVLAYILVSLTSALPH